MIEIRRYGTRTGKVIFGEWLSGLKDIRARAKIAVRIARVATGNFGGSRLAVKSVFAVSANLVASCDVFVDPIASG